MEAGTLLAPGDALAARGHEDAAGDAWPHAAAIFSAFLLPESDEMQSRLMRGRTPQCLNVASAAG